MDNFAQLWSAANAAGRKAAEACVPQPMVVQQVNPITGEVIKTYEPIMDGMCGFAWITVRPANSAFARWLKKQGLGNKAYYGGWEVSIHDYGQSYERKAAHAAAAVRVLRDAGIQATPRSNLD